MPALTIRVPEPPNDCPLRLDRKSMSPQTWRDCDDCAGRNGGRHERAPVQQTCQTARRQTASRRLRADLRVDRLRRPKARHQEAIAAASMFLRPAPSSTARSRSIQKRKLGRTFLELCLIHDLKTKPKWLISRKYGRIKG